MRWVDIAIVTLVRTSRKPSNVQTFKRSFGKCLNQTGYSYSITLVAFRVALGGGELDYHRG